MMTKVTERRSAAPAAVESTRNGLVYSPDVDIFETPDELTLLADLPGVRGEDIEIRYEDGELTVHGKVAPRRPEGARLLHREYVPGDFARSFRVGEGIDAGRITAECEGGVLTVRLPKAEAVKPRKIAVRKS